MSDDERLKELRVHAAIREKKDVRVDPTSKSKESGARRPKGTFEGVFIDNDGPKRTIAKRGEPLPPSSIIELPDTDNEKNTTIPPPQPLPQPPPVPPVVAPPVSTYPIVQPPPPPVLSSSNATPINREKAEERRRRQKGKDRMEDIMTDDYVISTSGPSGTSTSAMKPANSREKVAESGVEGRIKKRSRTVEDPFDENTIPVKRAKDYAHLDKGYMQHMPTKIRMLLDEDILDVWNFVGHMKVSNLDFAQLMQMSPYARRRVMDGLRSIPKNVCVFVLESIGIMPGCVMDEDGCFSHYCRRVDMDYSRFPIHQANVMLNKT